jgi:sulfide:quinone oxidoreductase
VRRIVILGTGTGGTLVANRLRRAFAPDEASIVTVDRDDAHLYQPGLLFVPFGRRTAASFTRPRAAQLHRGIDFVRGEVDHVDLAGRTVALASGETVPYDALVVAAGSTLAPEETEGLTGPGWNERVFTFYSPEGATALAGALARFGGGRLVVAVLDTPIKCPVAPLEFTFLAEDALSRRGLRARTEITYVTPLEGAFTRPVAAARLATLLKERDVELVTDFATASVDGALGRLTSYDGRRVDFDLAVVVPAHNGAAFVTRSPGLGDALGFVDVDPRTLQLGAHPEVFALGDVTGLATTKAGSVAHFEGEVLCDNVVAFLDGRTPTAHYDGHTNCFIELGGGEAILIDYNSDVEPLPGRFPGRLGLPLLAPSRIDHVGKLLFESLYWHALLPGHNLPGLGSPMPRAGKDLSALAGTTTEEVPT